MKNILVYYCVLQQLFYLTLQYLHGFPCGSPLPRNHHPSDPEHSHHQQNTFPSQPCLCGFSCVLLCLTTCSWLPQPSGPSTHKSKATGLAEADILTFPFTLCNPSKAFTCLKWIMTVKLSISSTGAVLKFSVMSQHEKQEDNQEGTVLPLSHKFQASTTAS